MTEATPPAPDEAVRCPWCSTEAPLDATTCPSCGAALAAQAASEIPGVTQVDPTARLNSSGSRRRGLLGWLTGEDETEEEPIHGVEPPSDEVRREMARLELEALRVELEARAAEAGGLRAADAGGATGDEVEAAGG